MTMLHILGFNSLIICPIFNFFSPNFQEEKLNNCNGSYLEIPAIWTPTITSYWCFTVPILHCMLYQLNINIYYWEDFSSPLYTLHSKEWFKLLSSSIVIYAVLAEAPFVYICIVKFSKCKVGKYCKTWLFHEQLTFTNSPKAWCHHPIWLTLEGDKSLLKP